MKKPSLCANSVLANKTQQLLLMPTHLLESSLLLGDFSTSLLVMTKNNSNLNSSVV